MEQVDRIRVRSVVDTPLKWGTGILALGVTLFCFRVDPIAAWAVLGLGLLISLTGGAFWVYFAVKKPDYLLSEDHQLRKQSITLLGDDSKGILHHAQEIVSIASPSAPRLPEGGSGKIGSQKP